MRAVLVMYDSLNKRFLGPYGNKWVKTPNFDRLARHTATFDNFYAGSLPCMPARRELHTGRLNFLHRGWGPCEPFDQSMPQLLREHGVYSHLVTDHCHYWEDGGANYHNRFASFSFVRGQEGDRWAHDVAGYDGTRRTQDRANRAWMCREEDHFHARCFREGERFLLDHLEEDNWYLQLEYFDPHEPFFVPDRFLQMYTYASTGLDWPAYQPVQPGDEEKVREQTLHYAALVSMCDEYLGKLLDLFDRYDLWKDTMLIVNTDHGYFLGERGFVGKNYMPVYDEIGNLPFFIHHPGIPQADGTRRTALAQTPDIPVTLLDCFGVERGSHMLGRSLVPAVEDDRTIHAGVLYGYHGMHVNVTDGRYTYLRAAVRPDNGPLYQYTLMPWHIAKPMAVPELRQAAPELYNAFAFNDHVPVLKIPVDERYDKKKYYRYNDHLKYGSLLFDRQKDPGQVTPLCDSALEERMCQLMVKLMKENEAPEEQYLRLGLNKRMGDE